MNHRLRFSCQLLLPGLALGSSLLALPSHADDTTGTALAAALNKQWLSSVESCTRGNDTLSALACSGVLLKTLPDTVAEKKMGAGGLLYLRHDLNPPAHLTGAVMPAGSALNPDAKGPGAACVRPVAVSTDTVRSGYGCGAATGTPSETGDSDASTCNQQEKGPGEAGWKWDGSCSLSVEIAPEFSLAMKLNQDSKGANPARNAMQVWYHRWPASLEGAKPQALVYTSGNDGELKARQADWASLKSAGLDVPVLKYTPGNATSPFSYVSQDNVVAPPETPKDVAERVIARYKNDNVKDCGNGTPAWQCSGLIARATGANHPFTQSDDVVHNRGVASYFYWREDTSTYTFYVNKQGIILKVPEAGQSQTTAGKKLLDTLNDRIKCIYPQDADTSGKHGVIAGYQCHKTNTRPTSSTDLSDCSNALQMSPDDEADNYTQAWYKHGFSGSANQCSFSTQKAGQFYAAIELTHYPKQDSGARDYTWNEMILVPSSDPKDIPEVEAVWYDSRDTSAAKKAACIVSKYQSLRGKTIPVLSFNGTRLLYEPAVPKCTD
jgi:hypothetical protein